MCCCYCDMTTGPDGDYVRPADRLVEIRGRYGPDHEVTRFVELAAPGDPGHCGACRGVARCSAEVGLWSVVEVVLDALAHRRVHLQAR